MSTGPGADSAPAPPTPQDSPPNPEAPPDTTGLPAPASGPSAPAPEASGTAPPAPAPAPASSSEPSAVDPAPRERESMFSSLKIRNYRLFFTGQVVSNTGTWMQRIAQDWLVLSLTGSADRRRHHHGAAVPADAAVRALRRGARRPAPQAAAAAPHPDGDGRDRPRARRRSPSPATSRSGTSTSPPSPLGIATVVDNPARQSFVVRDGRPGPAAERGQPQLRQLPVRPPGRPRRRRCADHRRRHRLGLPLQRPLLRRPHRRPAADAHPRPARRRARPARQGPAARGPALCRRPPRADLADRPRRLHRHLRLQLPRSGCRPSRTTSSTRAPARTASSTP